LFRDRELLEGFIRLVILRFGLYTSDTGFAELLYISIETRPGITIVN